MSWSRVAAAWVLLGTSAVLSPVGSARLQERLVYHEIRTDEGGRIISGGTMSWNPSTRVLEIAAASKVVVVLRSEE